MLAPNSFSGRRLGNGYLWWTADLRAGEGARRFKASFMLGFGGNIVMIVPELDAVIVVQATNYGVRGDFAISRALVEEYVLPALIESEASGR